MRVNANAVLRSWTLLAAFGGSYAPDYTYVNESSVGDIRSKNTRVDQKQIWNDTNNNATEFT